jgi:hypothetical protein
MTMPLDANRASVEIAGYIKNVLVPARGGASLSDILGAYIFFETLGMQSCRLYRMSRWSWLSQGLVSLVHGSIRGVGKRRVAGEQGQCAAAKGRQVTEWRRSSGHRRR